MLHANVGGLDRGLRIAVGVLLFVAGLVLLTGELSLSVILIALGLLALITGIARFCVLYIPFGISTARTGSPSQMCNCEAWFKKADSGHKST